MISQLLSNSLHYLANLMNKETEPWWIIGSGALVLSGVEALEPEDLDVVASSACIRRVLERVGIAEIEPSAHDKFRSIPYQRIQVPDGMDIELMGNLQVHDGSLFCPFVLTSRIPVEVAEAIVFIPSIAEQIAVLRLFGRDKDLAKAMMLEAHFKLGSQ
jgi:hypothetical protein